MTSLQRNQRIDSVVFPVNLPVIGTVSLAVLYYWENNDVSARVPMEGEASLHMDVILAMYLPTLTLLQPFPRPHPNPTPKQKVKKKTHQKKRKKENHKQKRR